MLNNSLNSEPGQPETASATVTRTRMRLVDTASLVAEAVLSFLLIGDAALYAANVIARALLGRPYAWLGEVSTDALITMTFVGGALAYSRNAHIKLGVFRDRIRALPLTMAVDAASDWTILLISGGAAVGSYLYVADTWRQRTVSTGTSEALGYLPVAVGLTLITIVALGRILKSLNRPSSVAGGCLVLIAAVAYTVPTIWIVSRATAAWIMLPIGLILLIVGVPIPFVLIGATLWYFYASGDAPIEACVAFMVQATSNLAILSLPFFIFAGGVMAFGGIAQRLTEAVRVFTGRSPGGLYQVIILAMFLFSGISGSKAADVAAVGTGVGPALSAGKYPSSETAAVLAASAAMGETIPPSTAILVLASLTDMSVGGLFLAGIVPAVVLAIALLLLVTVRGLRGHFPRTEKSTRSSRVKAITDLPVALIVPLVLVGGLVTGITTPADVAAVAVVLAVIITVVAYRRLNISHWRSVLGTSTTTIGMVLFVTAAGNSFSAALNYAGVASALGRLLVTSGGFGRIGFLLISFVILVFVGMLLEGLPAILILVPIIFPAATTLGVPGFQLAVVSLIAMGVGAFSPPIGVGAFTSCAVAGASLERSFGTFAVYMSVVCAGVVVLIIFQQLTTGLPHLFHSVT